MLERASGEIFKFEMINRAIFEVKCSAYEIPYHHSHIREPMQMAQTKVGIAQTCFANSFCKAKDSRTSSP